MHLKLFVRATLLASLLTCTTASYAQYARPAVILPADLEAAKKYQEQYKDQQAVILESNSVYEFKYDKGQKAPVVSEHKENLYLSLKLNNDLKEFEFYNDNSFISKVTLQNRKKQNQYFTKTCGNHEVENLFFTDTKICRYDIQMASVGEVKKLSIQKQYNDLKYFTAVYFHESFPVGQRSISFTIPDDMKIELREFNFEGFDIRKSSVKKGDATTYTYTLKSLNALKKEKNSPGYSFTYPHLLVLSKSYTLNGETKPLLNTVNDLYGWYASLVKEVNNEPTTLKPVVDQLIAGKQTDTEKIKAIYYWVQDNIRYIAFENGIAGFKPEAAHQVFQKKYGDCKGMANLTKEMLKLAGYDARLTWIGTNDIRYDYSIPSLAVDNHMICTVFLNESKLILDPTEKFISIEDLGERIQGRPIMIENGNSYILEKVPAFSSTRNLVTQEKQLQISGTSLIGTAQASYNGEMKTSLLNFLHTSKSGSRQKLLERLVTKGQKNFNIHKITHTDLNDREKPLEFRYDFELANKATVFENDIYLDIDPYQEYKDFNIEKDRQSDVFFHEKVLRKTRIRVKVPAGYKVTRLPANLNISHDSFYFTLNFKEENGEIVYEKEISIINGIIPKKDFEVWNTSIKDLRKTYNDQIVISKQ